MFILNSLAFLICGAIGFVLGVLFHILILKIDGDDRTSIDNDDRFIKAQSEIIEKELEVAILDWTRDEYADYSVMILENKDDPGIKLVTVYDVDNSEVDSAIRRIWEIIEACKNDYNVDRRGKFVYVPNVHSRSNTERFFPQYRRLGSK